MEGQAMYKRILVPVDGSACSAHGLAEAIRLAKNQGGSIRLMHVVNEFILDPAYSPQAYSPNVIEAIKESGKAVLERAAGDVRKAGVVCDTVLLESVGGPAADFIVAQAKEWPAELIVMGTHGRRGLRRLALGSDAESVVRLAPVPLLLVRLPDKKKG
jgi:nucleotide-binding universal stress UspA family protein